MGRLNKAFFHARLRPNGFLLLLDRAEEQDW
jgi:hypothetical protein